MKKELEKLCDSIQKEKVDTAIEIGMLVGFMSQEGRLEAMYQKVHEEWDVGGIADTVYTLTWWAMEFTALHKDTDWEEMYDSEIPWLSKKYQEYGGFQESYDIVAEDYAQWKVENFTIEEFKRINSDPNIKNPLLSRTSEAM